MEVRLRGCGGCGATGVRPGCGRVPFGSRSFVVLAVEKQGGAEKDGGGHTRWRTQQNVLEESYSCFEEYSDNTGYTSRWHSRAHALRHRKTARVSREVYAACLHEGPEPESTALRDARIQLLAKVRADDVPRGRVRFGVSSFRHFRSYGFRL